MVAGALCVAGARAQVPSLEAAGVPGIVRNSTANLHAQGDSLWVGSFLNLTTDGGASWSLADTDSLFGSRNSVFSIDVEGPVIWVGLGYLSDEASGSSEQSAGGFLVSEDGGRTFAYRFPQLDSPDNDTETYGVSTLEALPVIVPQQSPPFDIDYDPVTGELWVAAWASGIRHSTDGGRTWQRVVLPPDQLDYIHPDSSYAFKLEPRRGETGFFNYLGFGVLVDETGTVWAGTVAGVNRSTPDDVTPSGERAWRRFAFDGTSAGLTGNWVVSIEEQPLPGRNAIWMATWNGSDGRGPNQQWGVTVTRDGGETFEQVLTDEQVFDFAFAGDRVYAAGETGLFITDDGGTSWRTVRSFVDAAQPDRVVPSNVGINAVEVTANGDLWVGSTDGLFKSTDGGETWQVFRVEVPLHPATPTESIPEVDVFAYPNPFSPPQHRFTRIRYELERERDVRIRIFDFEMNLIRELDAPGQQAGIRETLWDGADAHGLRVANGPYFYVVDTGDRAFRGKILVIE
ncbi:MAG: FlgD immunoglobulin-like domain containing protein [Rhodothermales bacterium]